MKFEKGYIPWNKGLPKEMHPMYGKENKWGHHTEKTKEKLKGYIPWIKGKHHSEKTKKKMSENHWSKRADFISPKKGIKENPEVTQKRSEILKNGHKTGKYFLYQKGKTKNDCESLKKQSETKKRLFKNPEYVRKFFRWLSIKPNKKEQLLNQLLQLKFPNEFIYNGDFSQKILVGGKIPDFINCNGKKQIIELYGDYWHKNDNPQDRISLFKQYGFNTIIIWEKELKSPQLIVKKIKGEFYE